MTHEQIGQAVACALVRGQGTPDIHDVEIERGAQEVFLWAYHAELLKLLLDGKIDLAFKQRGAGALTVLRRVEYEAFR